MALTSPGVQVTVTDESQYAPAPTGTVATFIVASGQDKKQGGSTTATATGTTAANAGKTYLVSSQRELTQTFGNPKFYTTTAGTPIHGYENNEYGLMAAYSFLGVSNRAYVTRADINVDDLVSNQSRPTGNPTANTVWWDAGTDSRWGIFDWNECLNDFLDTAFVISQLDLVISVDTISA